MLASRPVSRPVAKALSLDCYGTLVAHRDGRGRSELLREYLRDRGLGGQWDGNSLYPLFASVPWGDPDRRLVWRVFTARLFERAGVQASREVHRHQDAVEAIFGPSAFELFPEVGLVLKRLKDAGFRLVVVSNWPDGLCHYLQGWGLSSWFEAVVTSAEEGHAKPDPRIFAAAAQRLGLPMHQVVHVGDQVESDVNGALAAGMQAVHLDREGVTQGTSAPKIRTLDGLDAWLMREHGARRGAWSAEN